MLIMFLYIACALVIFVIANMHQVYRACMHTFIGLNAYVFTTEKL
jgi:hypothetical protein